VTVVLVAVAGGGTVALARGSSGQDETAQVAATSPFRSGAITYGCAHESGSRQVSDTSATGDPACLAGSYVSQHGRVLPGRKRELSPNPNATSPKPSLSSAGPGLDPSTTSPSPSQSTTSPSPSPSESGAPCVTSSDGASCGPYDYPGITESNGYNTYVEQDVWNAISGASQTLTSYDPGDWSVSADMPASNTAVVSYPDVQQIYTTTSDTPDPLSTFASMTSDFTESMPSGGDNEAAYDIWTGDAATGNYAEEIMIWVDDQRTTTPLGTDMGTATFDGQTFQIWDSVPRGQSGTISFLLEGNETSGTVDLLSMLEYLADNGWIPADSGLNQVDFGWEICSTGGQPETFTMSSYDITSSCSAGASCLC
jgi:hypothetical protein